MLFSSFLCVYAFELTACYSPLRYTSFAHDTKYVVEFIRCHCGGTFRGILELDGVVW